MNLHAIHHQIESEYAYVLKDGSFVLRLRTARGDAARVAVRYRDQFKHVRDYPNESVQGMSLAFSDDLFDYFECAINDMPNAPLVCYFFEIDGEERWYYGHYRLTAEPPTEGFHMFYLYPQNRADACVVPEWAKDAVVYQVFPDRFAIGSSGPAGGSAEAAGASPGAAAGPGGASATSAGAAAGPADAATPTGAAGPAPTAESPAGSKSASGAGPATPATAGSSHTTGPAAPAGRAGASTEPAASSQATSTVLRGWNEHAGDAEFLGGTLEGITERLDHIAELGATVLYLTPIFVSDTAHRYNTHDYYRIDPRLGTMQEFKELVAEAHRRGMRVVLDAVFNHCGTGFFAFRDLLERGADSPYRDWFRVHRFPVEIKDYPNYDSFSYLGYMPKFNTENARVVEYLCDVATYWIREAGIDGWRLDCAPEVDHRFWRSLRSAVKAEKPEALLVGEFWHDARSWLAGDQIDSTLNYEPMLAVQDWLIAREIGAPEVIARLNRQRAWYRRQAVAAFWNQLDSHDTDRFLTQCGGEEALFRLGIVLQMTYLGVPVIYYGDEVGMAGADPYHRRGMRWQPSEQNAELLAFYRSLISLVRSEPAFRSPHLAFYAEAAQHGVLAFTRGEGVEAVTVLINGSDTAVELDGGTPAVTDEAPGNGPGAEPAADARRAGGAGASGAADAPAAAYDSDTSGPAAGTGSSALLFSTGGRGSAGDRSQAGAAGDLSGGGEPDSARGAGGAAPAADRSQSAELAGHAADQAHNDDPSRLEVLPAQSAAVVRGTLPLQRLSRRNAIDSSAASGFEM